MILIMLMVTIIVIIFIVLSVSSFFRKFPSFFVSIAGCPHQAQMQGGSFAILMCLAALGYVWDLRDVFFWTFEQSSNAGLEYKPTTTRSDLSITSKLFAHQQPIIGWFIWFLQYKTWSYSGGAKLVMIWVYDATEQMEKSSPKATQLKTVLRPFQWLIKKLCCMHVFPSPRFSDGKKIWRDKFCLPG